jgi:hypothetical protein
MAVGALTRTTRTSTREMRRIYEGCPVLISRLGDGPAHDGRRGRCVSCGRAWPRGRRRRAEAALALHYRSRAGVRPSVSAPTFSPTADVAPPDALAVYRAEVYLDDGCWSRAEWLGRAEYPDLTSAKLWLLDTLESLRGRAGLGVEGMLWGEVTAGRFRSRVLVLDSAPVIMFNVWFPLEDWGASGTAYLPGASDAITWDSDQVFKVTDQKES